MPTLKVPVTKADHILGNDKAPITLVEYGDFQCPHCERAHVVMQQILKHFGNKLRYVFRNFPLTEIHPLAEKAAETAEFAAEFNRYWQMHNLLFDNQNLFSDSLFEELAVALKLPSNELNEALAKKTFESKIKSDFLGGVKSGVNGTPTFFINEHRYNGSFEFEDLASAIDAMLLNP